ncbi:MAG: hypothetical protein HQL06_12055 [Nitrospirae bacterium]|nr:hypothetical protein [Nitrospirota bacterium]
MSKGIPNNWQLKSYGDYNGDGKADIVWQDKTSDDVVLWLMDGVNIGGGSYITKGLSNDWQFK